MSLMLKTSALLLAIAYCSTAYGELAAQVTVETTREPNGWFRYDYLVENLLGSEFRIGAFGLDVGPGADPRSFDQPPAWTHVYSLADDPFELEWISRSLQSVIPIGGTGTFSFLSPLKPGDIDFYFLADLAPDPSDLETIFGVVEGPLVAPLPGDYNDNGHVEQGDLDLVLLNWGDAHVHLPPEWLNQHPTTGIVDQAELDGVLLNWGNVAGAAAIPEPATVTMAVFACLAAVAVRRRQ